MNHTRAATLNRETTKMTIPEAWSAAGSPKIPTPITPPVYSPYARRIFLFMCVAFSVSVLGSAQRIPLETMRVARLSGGCGRDRTCNRSLWRRLRCQLRHAPKPAERTRLHAFCQDSVPELERRSEPPLQYTSYSVRAETSGPSAGKIDAGQVHTRTIRYDGKTAPAYAWPVEAGGARLPRLGQCSLAHKKLLRTFALWPSGDVRMATIAGSSRTVTRMGLESTMRDRGRPRKGT